MTTKEKVIKVIAEIHEISEIKEEDFLKEDLGLDSLMIVLVIANLEEAFDIRFDMGELNPDELLTVSDIIALVNRTL